MGPEGTRVAGTWNWDRDDKGSGDLLRAGKVDEVNRSRTLVTLTIVIVSSVGVLDTASTLASMSVVVIVVVVATVVG